MVDYEIVNTIIAIVFVVTACFIAVFIVVRAFPRDSNYKVRAIVRYPDKPIVKKISTAKKAFTIKRLGMKRQFEIMEKGIKHNTIIYNYDNRSPLMDKDQQFSAIMNSADANEITETTLLQRIAASKMVQTGLLAITVIVGINLVVSIIGTVATQNSYNELNTRVDNISFMLNQTRSILSQGPKVIP